MVINCNYIKTIVKRQPIIGGDGEVGCSRGLEETSDYLE
jgi:hypothetical protein